MRMSLLVLAAGALLGGCGPAGFGEHAKVAAAIDAGLAKNAVCERLPIDVAVQRGEVAQHAFELKLLQDKGLIEPKTLQGKDMFGHDVPTPGFATTEAGKGLIQQAGSAGWIYLMPCVRVGRYKVKSVEAVDEAADAMGAKVASVRARIVFEPEAWFADTRSAPEVVGIWKSAQSNEQQQWMYRLMKSGNDYFFTGLGAKLDQGSTR